MSMFVRPIGSIILPLSLRTSCANVLSKCFPKTHGCDDGLRMKFHNDGIGFFNPYSFCGVVADASPTRMYDVRKYGHCLPKCNARPDFPALPDIPTDVFRYTAGEKLGPQGQAGKCCMYRNPEYFSFHHMTYYDMHLCLRTFRKASPATNRKP